jgi:uncharacterized OsmC-like protein
MKFSIDESADVPGENTKYYAPADLLDHAWKACLAIFAKLDWEAKRSLEVLRVKFTYNDEANDPAEKVAFRISTVWKFYGEKLTIETRTDFHEACLPETVACIVTDSIRVDLNRQKNRLQEKTSVLDKWLSAVKA